MKTFNDNDFLLTNDYGRKLYHGVAASLPVIDPHNHIDPAVLATNKRFENIYQLRVQHDPYKHRAMRIYGIDEELITGSKPEYEKFLAWATCFRDTVGNPLFHWSCMELQGLFGIKDILTPSSAQQIWDKANDLLREEKYRALNVAKHFGVELLCTSDDLNDTLEHHLELAKQQNGFTCLPSLRADRMISFNQPAFYHWLENLQAITSSQIDGLDAYKSAIIKRLDFFDESGCLLSDHSLDSGFTYTSCNKSIATSLFEKVLNREVISDEEHVNLQSYLLHFLGG